MLNPKMKCQNRITLKCHWQKEMPNDSEEEKKAKVFGCHKKNVRHSHAICYASEYHDLSLMRIYSNHHSCAFFIGTFVFR